MEHLTDSPQARFDQEWDQRVQPLIDQLLSFLNDGIRALSTKRLFSHEERMRAYNVTYKMASESDDSVKEVLYQKHYKIIKQYLEEKMVPGLKEKHGDAILKAFVERWEVFRILNKWMESFFYYLNNYHVKYKGLLTLSQQGLKAFREEVFDQVRQQVTQAFLRAANAERKGESLSLEASVLNSTTLIYKAMDVKDLSVYETDLEKPYLDDVSAFYLKQSQGWLDTDSTSEFLAKMEKAIETEARRVQAYMLSSTDGKVRKVISEDLLRVQGRALLENENSGIRAMLKQDKVDDLARAFRMFNEVTDGLPPIAQIMRQHIVAEGKVILDKREAELAQQEGGKESGSDAGFIQALLELHEKYRRLVEIQFKNHREFQKELKAAFEETINTDIGKHSNAELLSTYADSVLKTGGEEKLTDSQIEDVLEKVVALFSFLADKDVFADVYRNHLAKRLLNQRSVSQFAEKSMISKLKLKCGAHFTSKFEGMLNDFGLCEDLQKRFGTWLETNPASKPPVEFACEVLTTGHWPSFRIVSPEMPPVLGRCVDVFESFYKQNTDHRRLTWVHSLGNVTVKGNFKIAYDFQVTTLQALCMLIFNGLKDGQVITFQQVNDRLGRLDVEVTKRILHSLSCQKVRVLNKLPESKKIEETDSFSVFTEFQSKIRKVRIPMASLDETHNQQRVEEDRGLAIEAAIVRIMKTRKRLLHTHLVTEVMAQLRTFKPVPKVIKKKIEHLIERDYLKRDEGEANVYHYVA